MKRLLIILVLVQIACSVSAVQIPAKTGSDVQTGSTLFAPRNDFQTPSTPKNSNSVSSTTVTANTLNVRTGPGTDYPVIPHVYLVNGETVTVLECSGLWARIGAGKWINSVYLSEPCE